MDSDTDNPMEEEPFSKEDESFSKEDEYFSFSKEDESPTKENKYFSKVSITWICLRLWYVCVYPTLTVD